MNRAIFGMTPTGVVITVAAGTVLAELIGYGLHRLMHSGRFRNLSRAHMIHHLALYGPYQPMRQSVYKDATVGRAGIGNVGMEWLTPCAMILGVIWAVLYAVGVGWQYRLLMTLVLIGWPVLMFSYVHDGMHVTGFWMERVPLMEEWYVRARRLHDIHHRRLNDNGKMDRNFGIGFFLFDRIFRTIQKRHSGFNRKGYEKALRRHADLGIEEDAGSFPSGYRVKP